jgi:hypothetical protein
MGGNLAKKEFYMEKLCKSGLKVFVALACILLAAGCGGQKPVPHTELATRLGSLKGKAGASPDAPYTVKIASVNIKAVGVDINKAVYTAGKYVILDFSVCSVPENTINADIGKLIKDNEYLKGIILPDSLTSIGDNAFKDCGSLTSVTISAGVTSISRSAFSGCTNLGAITVKSANTAFASEDGVLLTKDKTTLVLYPYGKGTSYTIPAKITGIGDSAFSGCKSLTSVTIPNTVISIGNLAFYRCGGLTDVTIPDSVTSIGDGAFSECSGLTSIAIPAGFTNIGNQIFQLCSGLTSVTIPDSVISIGKSAFRGCSGLTVITIPAGLTSIGSESFYDCDGLTSITIPAGVTSIGDYAFQDCDGLTSVTFESSISPDNLGESLFKGGLEYTYRAGGAGTYAWQSYTREVLTYYGLATRQDYRWVKQ